MSVRIDVNNGGAVSIRESGERRLDDGIGRNGGGPAVWGAAAASRSSRSGRRR